MLKNKIRIAVVDDEELACMRIHEHLSEQGFPVDFFFDGESFLKSYVCAPHDLVITDMKLPGIDGLEILKQVKSLKSDAEVFVITGYATIDSAIDAIKAGAFHYMTKPIRLEEFDNLMSRVMEKILLRIETEDLRAMITKKAGRDGMIGTSPEMTHVYELIEKVAPLECSVILHGESGTGKELAARAIHRLSKRNDEPIVSLNCGGFSPELIANELFGHEKGAFTGAHTLKIGLLESADKGTVFLDEIAEMPHEMQVKLLRVIQEGQLFRLGGNKPVNIDIRIIAATHRDLSEEVKNGRFREDLYFRLNVMTLKIPRLKERTGDLMLLADHFLHKFNSEYSKNIKGFSDKAKESLMLYSYPGNVRELENIISRTIALSEGELIEVSDLPPHIAANVESKNGRLSSLDEMEKEHISKILEIVQGQRNKAADILGITRSTLWRKMKKFNLMIE